MQKSRGFTLIELLVVVGVIAILIAILVPSLSKARAEARAVKCGTGMRAVGQGVSIYLTAYENVYPPSYVYPDASGAWALDNQVHPPANGYMHWSYFLFGEVKDQRAFMCPEFEKGGVPRTNPGPNGGYWMDGQVDQNGASTANNAVEDRQAPFVAFSANAALMPRNKFTENDRDSDPSTAGGDRLNGFVRNTSLTHASSTILATEFNSNWKTIAQPQGGKFKALGHRPIMPFGLLGSTNEFSNPPTAPFTNVSAASLMDSASLQSQAAADYSLINDNIQLNAVGRNHPGVSTAGGKSMGGSSNFLYVDSHVERKSIVTALDAREFGNQFYSISGTQTVR